VFYHFLGTVGVVPGNPVIQPAVENVQLAESADIPIIDRKDVYDGDAKKNSVDLISKCSIAPINFVLYSPKFFYTTFAGTPQNFL
jgi:hypothetical protein